MRLLILLCLTIQTISCVTRNNTSKPKKDLEMTCSIGDLFNSGNARDVNIWLTNNTDDWMTYKVSHDGFKVLRGQANVLTPKQIAAYHVSLRDTRELKSKEGQALNSLLFLATLTTAVVSQNRSVSNAAGKLALGTAVASAVETEREESMNVESDRSYAKRHVLGEEVQIPSTLSTKKTLLLESKNWKSDSDFKFCLDQPEKSCYKLSIDYTYTKARTRGDLPYQHTSCRISKIKSDL